MSNPLLVLMALTNAGIAFGYWDKDNYGMAITFAAYAVACMGFIWANLAGKT